MVADESSVGIFAKNCSTAKLHRNKKSHTQDAKKCSGIFFFFWNLGCIRWLGFFWLGFVLVFFCRIISADSVRLLLWIDGVENLKNPSDSSADFLCPFN